MPFADGSLGHLPLLDHVYPCLLSSERYTASLKRQPCAVSSISPLLESTRRDSAVIARSFFLRNKYVSRGKQEAISMGLSGQTMSAISATVCRERNQRSSSSRNRVTYEDMTNFFILSKRAS